VDNIVCPTCDRVNTYTAEPYLDRNRYRITCGSCGRWDGPFTSMEEALDYWTPRQDTAPTVTPVELRSPEPPKLDRGTPHIEEGRALPDLGPVVPITPTEGSTMVDENGKLSPIVVSILQAVIVAAAGLFNWSVSQEQTAAIVLAIGAIVYAVTIVLKTAKMWKGVKQAAQTTDGLPPKA
jgi:hypothetical protein